MDIDILIVDTHLQVKRKEAISVDHALVLIFEEIATHKVGDTYELACKGKKTSTPELTDGSMTPSLFFGSTYVDFAQSLSREEEVSYSFWNENYGVLITAKQRA